MKNGATNSFSQLLKKVIHKTKQYEATKSAKNKKMLRLFHVKVWNFFVTLVDTDFWCIWIDGLIGKKCLKNLQENEKYHLQQKRKNWHIEKKV